MSDLAIRVNNLGKMYRIGVANQPSRNWWQRARNLALSSFGYLQRMTRPPTEEETLWAIRNVSFEVRRGEVLGIIGRNGAGKSTLLKVLSRITEPTEGRAMMNGRVTSLLEIGTGFHPELTGRENIYLNGAILGMKRAEIDRRFDEMVDFAGVEKFIDTPVKRYSSGMYVRLAFAVAAHLESEILLVDEVLAVGDAAFQKKALGKMGDAVTSGRTVLFVSHNMGAISQLCSRAIVMKEGKLVVDGDASTAVSMYLSEIHRTSNAATFDVEQDKDVQITAISVVSLDGNTISTHPHTHPFCVLVDYHIAKWHVGSYVCLDVFNEADHRLLWSCDVKSVDDMLVERPPGMYRAQITIPGMVLSPGGYYFTAAIYAPGIRRVFDVKDKVISIEITDGGSLLSSFGIRPHAATMIPLSWETKRL